MKKCFHVLTVALVFAAVFTAFPKTASARTYFPTQGRFAQCDPFPNANLYVYVNNNPTRFTDPTGQIKVTSGYIKSIEQTRTVKNPEGKCCPTKVTLSGFKGVEDLKKEFQNVTPGKNVYYHVDVKFEIKGDKKFCTPIQRVKITFDTADKVENLLKTGKWKNDPSNDPNYTDKYPPKSNKYSGGYVWNAQGTICKWWDEPGLHRKLTENVRFIGNPDPYKKLWPIKTIKFEFIYILKGVNTDDSLWVYYAWSFTSNNYQGKGTFFDWFDWGGDELSKYKQELKDVGVMK